MKNTPIKFRGKRVNTGELVYGDLTHDGRHIYINDRRVKPESVAQLICYDYDGEEVYEGDVIVNRFDGDQFEVFLSLSDKPSGEKLIFYRLKK